MNTAAKQPVTLPPDMCDGIAQGHDGINYSLPHRDAIVNLVEAQANASVYDAVFLSPAVTSLFPPC